MQAHHKPPRQYYYLNGSTWKLPTAAAQAKRRAKGRAPLRPTPPARDELACNDVNFARAGRVLVSRTLSASQRVYEVHESIEAFLAHAVRAAPRTYFCILEPRMPLSFFADLELEPKHCARALYPHASVTECKLMGEQRAPDVMALFARVDFPAVCTRVLRALRCALESLYMRSMHAADVWLFRGDKRPVAFGHVVGDEVLKYSCHAYVTSWVWHDISELERAIKYCVPVMAHLLRDDALALQALDVSVYNENRNMRLPLNEKAPDARNHLLPWLCGERAQRSDAEWMRKGMALHNVSAAEAAKHVLPRMDDVLHAGERLYATLCTHATAAGVVGDTARAAMLAFVRAFDVPEPEALVERIVGAVARVCATSGEPAPYDRVWRSACYGLLLRCWRADQSYQAVAPTRVVYDEYGRRSGVFVKHEALAVLTALGVTWSADTRALHAPSLAELRTYGNHWTPPTLTRTAICMGMFAARAADDARHALTCTPDSVAAVSLSNVSTQILAHCEHFAASASETLAPGAVDAWLAPPSGVGAAAAAAPPPPGFY